MKIHITGNAGSGKTTLAKELGTILNMKVFGLDKIVWQAGWKKTPSEERKRLEQQLVAESEWIIEGVSLVARQSSDFIIFLDFPRYTCVARCLKRNSRFLFRSRPELPENCPEIKIIPQLLRIIWQFPKVARPFIIKDLGNIDHVIIASNCELNDFINEVRQNKVISLTH